jgi:hemerythrin-like domain-containing protein
MLHAIGHRSHPEDLVGLFLECHQRIRTFARLAEDVGRRHDLAGAEVIDTCRRCERYFTEALPLHVEDEEKSLLPRLTDAGPELEDALAAMRVQHLEHVPLLHALLESLRAVQGDPGVAHQRQRLEAGARHLVQEFEKHLTLEEQVIFPAVRARIPGDVQDIVIQELRARRRPPGP